MFYQIYIVSAYIHIVYNIHMGSIFVKKHSLLMFLTKLYTEICFFRFTNTNKFNKDISLWNLLIYMVWFHGKTFFVYEISVVVLSRRHVVGTQLCTCVFTCFWDLDARLDFTKRAGVKNPRNHHQTLLLNLQIDHLIWRKKFSHKHQ